MTDHATGWHSRGYLPHFNAPGAIQILTIRLTDSLPADLLRRIYSIVPRHQSSRRRQYIERLLDNGYGECWLANPEIASIVQESILHFDQDRYRVLAWVVMPNHVHYMVETYPSYPVHKLIFSLKSYTANQINRVLGRSGTVWQREYFDRMVRDADHYRAAVEYIHNNPVKAKLVSEPREWKFSSAAIKGMNDRQQEPLGECRQVAGAP